MDRDFLKLLATILGCVVFALGIAYVARPEFRSYLHPVFYYEIEPEYIDPNGEYVEYRVYYRHLIKGNVIRWDSKYNLTREQADSIIEKEKKMRDKYKKIFNEAP